jgi:hypothetical protein
MRTFTLATALLLVTWLSIQADEPASQPGVFRLGEVTVDRSKRQLTLPARVVQASYSLEFLLCRENTKEYESVLSTSASGSQIHAGLLLLGLAPGVPAEVTAEGYLPPRGAKLGITLRWSDRAGQRRSVQAGDWLKVVDDAEAQRPEDWIFVGSDLLAGGGYLADQDGGLIAVANLPSAVIDVPFRSSRTMEHRQYVIDTQALPPVGTAVTMTITARAGAERADVARALLEIDRNARLAMDGQPIAMPQLSDWAESYTRAHREGMVVIRLAPQASAGLAVQAQLELKLGGVYHFDRQIVPFTHTPLPRTPDQLRRALRSWQDIFAQPNEQLIAPDEQLETTLERLHAERAELKRLDALWAGYQRQLERLSETTTSQPEEAE